MNERRRICEEAIRIVTEVEGNLPAPAVLVLVSGVKSLAKDIPNEYVVRDAARTLFAIGSACEKLAIAIELPLEEKTKPTPEERVKNKALACGIIRYAYPHKTALSDEVLNEDPFALWLEAIIHDIRIGKR